MKNLARSVLTPAFFTASSAVACIAIAASLTAAEGCSSSDNSSLGDTGSVDGSAFPDSGLGLEADSAPPPAAILPPVANSPDASDGAATRDGAALDGSRADGATNDGSSEVDAGPPPAFCQRQTGLAFCADFDEADSLTPGGTRWDAVLNTVPDGGVGNLSTSSARAVSDPSSLLVNLTAAAGGDAKVVKKVSQTVNQATYEFDVYFEALPSPGAGGFLTDFQFSDTDGHGNPAADTFGFRISIFSNDAGQLDHANLEHNFPALPAGGHDDVNPISLRFGAWNHVKMAASFSAASTANKVSFQLYINRVAAPALDKTYDSPFATASFARIAAGMVYSFGGPHDFKYSLDNVTLKVQ